MEASGTSGEKGVMNGTISATSGSTALTLAYNKTRSETPANLADAVGVWKGSYNGGSIVSTLTVASTTGAVSGSSTTGCTYSGTLMPRQADPAFFDVNFTESCPAFAGTTVVTLSGIAILNETANALSFAATSVDKASGAMFTGVRQ